MKAPNLITMVRLLGVLEHLQKKAEASWRVDDPFRRGYEQALFDIVALTEEEER